jgi:co-chaperonin GroES (HSP10)
MLLKPLRDLLLIRVEKEAPAPQGAIIMPDSHKKAPANIATVVDYGPLVTTVYIQGDRILFDPYAAREYTIDGESFMLVPQDHVLGILC